MKCAQWFRTIGLRSFLCSLLFCSSFSLAKAASCFDGVTEHVARGETVTASGWACGYEQGAPVSHVYLYSYSGYVGEATLGGYRPDVQAANASVGYGWSPNDVTYSGWSYSMSTEGMSVGTHTFFAYAVSMEWQWTDPGDGNGYWEYIEVWEDMGQKSFTVHGIPPAVVGASSSDCELSGWVLLTGHATHAPGELQWMDFYVSGPGLPGWNYVGGTGISGGEATGQIWWKPLSAGNWAVHVRARSVDGEWDSTGGQVAGFTVSEPVIAPPPSPLYLDPTGEDLTLVHVGDQLSAYTWEYYYDAGGEYVSYQEPREVLFWNGSNWVSQGCFYDYTVVTPGLYKVVAWGAVVYVLHPASPPTATISADRTTIGLGESTTVRATFSPGAYDRLTNTNIDSPEGTGLPGLDAGQASNKD